jgi:hypothetical protein
VLTGARKVRPRIGYRHRAVLQVGAGITSAPKALRFVCVGRPVGRRNVLNVPGLDCPPLPCTQYLIDTLMRKAVSRPDSRTVPPQYEVQVNHLPLQVGAVMLFESRDLRGEAHFSRAELVAELVDAQLNDAGLVKRLGRAPAPWSGLAADKQTLPAERGIRRHGSSVSPEA